MKVINLIQRRRERLKKKIKEADKLWPYDLVGVATFGVFWMDRKTKEVFLIEDKK